MGSDKISRQNNTAYEDEIDLSDLFKVLLRRKATIAAVFMIFTLVAVLASFITPPVYKASASIMVVPYRLKAFLSPSLSPSQTIPDEGKSGPIYSPATHMELLRSGDVLRGIISALGLKDRKGDEMSPDALYERLKISEVEGANILKLEAIADTPQKATQIADAWARQYVKYNQELIFEEAIGKGNFVYDQFQDARESLIGAEKNLRDFNTDHKLGLVKTELDMKKSTLNSYKKELVNLEVSLSTKNDNLSALKEQIAGQTRFIIVSKAITDEALWQKNHRDLSGLDDIKLRSESINPIFKDLETRIVDLKVEINTLKARSEHIRNSKKNIAADVDRLTKTINDLDFENMQLERQRSIHENTYKLFASRIEEARIVKATQLGDIKITSFAIKPRFPVSPRKKLWAAIGGLLGLMSGIFLAFFMEFLQNSKKT